MSRELPALSALRAFEAAGRHLSLTRAGEELHVTPAAVSHQVKALEDTLQIKLFKRAGRSLLLTEAGQALLAPLSEGFDRLADAVSQVRRVEQARPLTITAAPSFAAKWLVNRLDRFHERHPDIDVRVDAATRVADLAREDIDLAIRYGPGDYPGLHVECLLDDEVFPVCSPRLLDGPHPLEVPADLAHQVLLHHDFPPDSGGYPDWKMWLLAAGVTGVDASRGPRFSIASMAVQAAVEGQGVCLVGSVLVEDDLEAGRLVRPFQMGMPVGFRYYIVCPQHTVNAPRVRAMREWLLDEARAGRRAGQSAVRPA